MHIEADLRHYEVPESLVSKYGVVHIDWPWKHSNAQNNASVRGGVYYERMELEEIIQATYTVNLMCKYDCMVFLWHLWPKQYQYAKVLIYMIEELGFSDLTGLPWVKVVKDDIWRPRYGIGYHLGACSEPCTILRRGKVPVPNKAEKPLGLLGDAVYKHSKKPEIIYDICERYPGPYLNVCARNKREGWDSIGNESL